MPVENSYFGDYGAKELIIICYHMNVGMQILPYSPKLRDPYTFSVAPPSKFHHFWTFFFLITEPLSTLCPVLIREIISCCHTTGL